MTRQYAANRRRLAALLAYTRVSVVTIEALGPSGLTTKFIVATAKPGGVTLNMLGVSVAGREPAGAPTTVPTTISRGRSSASQMNPPLVATSSNAACEPAFMMLGRN